MKIKKENYLFEAMENLSVKKFITTDEYIFFTAYTHQKDREILSLWRMNNDGSELVKLYDKENINIFYVVGDKIFAYNRFFPREDSKITVLDYDGNLIDFDM